MEEPAPDRLRTGPRLVVFAVLAVSVAAIGYAIVTDLPDTDPGAPESRVPDTGSSDPDSRVPPVLRIEDNGLRYTFHLPSGLEGLFDLDEDPRCLKNLARERPGDAMRLREQLTRRLRDEMGVERLEDLRATFREREEQLRSLGYL